MAKKGTNIYKRKDGRWEGRYISEVLSDGTKKYSSVYGKTYKEAREKQLLQMSSVHLKNNKKLFMTTEELMWEWLGTIINKVKRTTFQKYESIIKNHICLSSIASLQIKYITGKIISTFANERLKSVSAKTVNDILIIVGLAFSYAEEEYGLPKPHIHRIKEEAKEMRVLSVIEQKRLETYLFQDTDLYKLGVLLALYTGIRIGELCALEWKDITDKYIVINKTLHRIKEGDVTVVEITEPKTKTSNRKIPIPLFLLPVIDRFRTDGYVITNRNKNLVEPRLMQLSFKKIISDCELPKTNFHALRHTFATRCIEAGFDVKSLSEILGHADVKTTLNRYVHSSLEQKQRNMDLLKPAINM